MSVSVALLGAMAVLYVAGVYLLLERSVTRIILGFLLIGNATNLLLLSLAGPPGAPPLAGRGTSSDPLPQALILTAIVITFAVSAFLMALVYRSWRLAQEDEVTPDETDTSLRRSDQPQPEDAAADEESEFDRTAPKRDAENELRPEPVEESEFDRATSDRGVEDELRTGADEGGVR